MRKLLIENFNKISQGHWVNPTKECFAIALLLVMRNSKEVLHMLLAMALYYLGGVMWSN